MWKLNMFHVKRFILTMNKVSCETGLFIRKRYFMKIFTSKKQKIGLIGEVFSKMFLVKQGFIVLELNFSSRFGEIDIVATKNNRIYFFEVKTSTVSHETGFPKKTTQNSDKDHFSEAQGEKNVSRETFVMEYRKLSNPLENISKLKIRRLLKTVDIYLLKNNVSRETRWQLDCLGVYIDNSQNLLKIDRIENISIH